MRKSENAPAVTSRPAAKPSKRDAAVTIEKCDRIPDRDTMGRAGAQGRQLCAVLSIAGPALPRGRVGNAAQTQPAVPYLLYWRGVPGVRPRLAGVRVPPAIGRGASLVSASQQTVAENAKTRAHLKPAFTIYLGPRRPDCTAVGVRWRIPKPRDVGIEPHYCLAARNLQGAEMTLFPLIMTWMWFEIFKTAPIPSLAPRGRGHQQR